VFAFVGLAFVEEGFREGRLDWLRLDEGVCVRKARNDVAAASYYL